MAIFTAMKREIHGWFSPSLHRHMEVAVYGHYGFSLLLFPTAAADYLEYERFHLIAAISRQIESGKVKVFSINSINNESWLNPHAHPRAKSIRHQQYNHYIVDELVPFIRDFTSQETPIITCGASLGALHSANQFFRRPDIFAGFIGMSGDYDLSSYTGGYHDEEVYFNSPMQYMPNLGDDWLLSRMRQSNHLHIVTGSGAWENPEASRRFSGVLHQKGIPHELDVWGGDMAHDWP
ncbi:MAG: esterase, partial [Saprospiraceae bacterium]|nr:esterase [Saprospiraceae bacterium]